MSAGRWFSEQIGFYWGVKAVVQRALLELVWLNVVTQIPDWNDCVDLWVSMCVCLICKDFVLHDCCSSKTCFYLMTQSEVFTCSRVAAASHKLKVLDVLWHFCRRWWNKPIMSALMAIILQKFKRKANRWNGCLWAESPIPRFVTDKTRRVRFGLVSGRAVDKMGAGRYGALQPTLLSHGILALFRLKMPPTVCVHIYTACVLAACACFHCSA